MWMKRRITHCFLILVIFRLLTFSAVASAYPPSAEINPVQSPSVESNAIVVDSEYERKNLFWNAFGAVGGTLGALATAGAVVVALWQTKYSQKKKLKVSFTDDIAVVADGGGVIYRFVGISAVNIGNRDVILSSWGFELSNGQRMLIVPDTSRIGKVVSVTLPYKLSIEETQTLMCAEEVFFRVIKESVASGDLGNNQKIRFYIMDSTGREYTALSTKTVQEYLAIADKRDKQKTQQVLN